METFFENTGTPDIRAMTEIRYRFGMKRTWIWIGIYLLLGTFFLLGRGRLAYPLILYGYAVYLLVTPYLRLRKEMQSETQLHNGKLPVNTIRFDEKIQIYNDSASRTWEYAHLVQVYSLKYSYCLRFSNNSALVMDRTNFTKGTFEEFKAFLREKRPDLKIPE